MSDPSLELPPCSAELVSAARQIRRLYASARRMTAA